MASKKNWKWYYLIESRNYGSASNVGGGEAIYKTRAAAKRAGDAAVDKLLESGWLRSDLRLKINAEV